MPSWSDTRKFLPSEIPFVKLLQKYNFTAHTEEEYHRSIRYLSPSDAWVSVVAALKRRRVVR
jgi:hypothetical protein